MGYNPEYHGLLSNGFDVYVTDIWKCWFLCKFIKRGPWKIGNPYFDCLIAEMKYINPDYVILMGDLAQNMFDRKTFRNAISLSKKQLIRVPHPSGSANGLWKNIVYKSDTNSKVVYILNEVLKHQKIDKA